MRLFDRIIGSPARHIAFMCIVMAEFGLMDVLDNWI